MGFIWLLNLLVICAFYNIIVDASVQKSVGKYVNETLVLGKACHARPRQRNFFNKLDNLINTDLDLIILDMKIPYKNTTGGKSFRFDLIMTASGQLLLSLKSQLDFLTLNLPLLSDRVDRQYLELILSPPDCIANITLNDTLIKTWLLHGLTKEQDGIEHLSVQTLCIELPYKEPNVWYLFYDTFVSECSEMPVKDSKWAKSDEDPLVKFYRGALNYGVSVVTIVCMVVLTTYRLFRTKPCLFLCKLDKSVRKECEVVDRSKDDKDAVQLFPDKINFPVFKFEMCNLKESVGCKVECSGYRQSDRWLDIKKLGKSPSLKIAGFWFDIRKDVLITCKSFGLLSPFQTFVEEIGATLWELRPKCCRNFRYFVIVILRSFLLILVLGAIIGFTNLRIYGNLNDPFYTLLDAISVFIILGVVAGVKILTFCCQGFNRNEIPNIIGSVTVEAICIVMLYLMIALSVRITLILLLGLVFYSGSNDYTVVSTAALSVLSNGYYQLQTTHKRYLNFLDMCMKEITKLVYEKDTLNEPHLNTVTIVSNNENDLRLNHDRDVLPDCKGDKGVQEVPREATVNGLPVWPTRDGNSLTLTLEKRFAVFLLSNGELAIDRDFFLGLCKANNYNSPGDLRWTVCKDLIKFIFWGGVVSGIIYVQHIIAKSFDSSFFSQAPGTVFSVLLPIVFSYMFSGQNLEEENSNLTSLFNDSVSDFKKKYRVIDFEIDGKPRTVTKTRHLGFPCCTPLGIKHKCHCSCMKSGEDNKNNDEDVNEENDDEDVNGTDWEKISFETSQCLEWSCCQEKSNHSDIEGLTKSRIV